MTLTSRRRRSTSFILVAPLSKVHLRSPTTHIAYVITLLHLLLQRLPVTHTSVYKYASEVADSPTMQVRLFLHDEDPHALHHHYCSLPLPRTSRSDLHEITRHHWSCLLQRVQLRQFNRPDSRSSVCFYYLVVCLNQSLSSVDTSISGLHSSGILPTLPMTLSSCAQTI